MHFPQIADSNVTETINENVFLLHVASRAFEDEFTLNVKFNKNEFSTICINSLDCDSRPTEAASYSFNYEPVGTEVRTTL